MRHVTRTHRVADDAIFGKINYDPRIRIKYITTKDQLSDMFTERHVYCNSIARLIRMHQLIPTKTETNVMTSISSKHRQTCYKSQTYYNLCMLTQPFVPRATSSQRST